MVEHGKVKITGLLRGSMAVTSLASWEAKQLLPDTWIEFITGVKAKVEGPTTAIGYDLCVPAGKV